MGLLDDLYSLFSHREEGSFGTGYLDEMEYFSNPDVQKAYQKFIEGGGRMEVVIHKNTSDFFRRLGKKGEIKLFYTPHISPIIAEITGEWIHLKSNRQGGNALGIEKPIGKVLQKEIEYYESLEKYRIPSDKVDLVFEMIKSEVNPEDIVNFIQAEL